VHAYDATFPIGIVTLPPKPQSGRKARDLFNQSLKMYRELGADVLNEGNVDGWARRAVERVPVELQY